MPNAKQRKTPVSADEPVVEADDLTTEPTEETTVPADGDNDGVVNE